MVAVYRTSIKLWESVCARMLDKLVNKKKKVGEIGKVLRNNISKLKLTLETIKYRQKVVFNNDLGINLRKYQKINAVGLSERWQNGKFQNFLPPSIH